MDTKRLQFEIPRKEAEELDQLQESLGLKTRVALFNEAITFYKWAVDERRKGRIIASVDEEKEEYKEIEMTSFPDPHPDQAVDEESRERAREYLNKIIIASQEEGIPMRGLVDILSGVESLEGKIQVVEDVDDVEEQKIVISASGK